MTPKARTSAAQVAGVLARPSEDGVTGHVWTAPAVQEESDVLRSVRVQAMYGRRRGQEESDVLRSVRVQPCMRPVFA